MNYRVREEFGDVFIVEAKHLGVWRGLTEDGYLPLTAFGQTPHIYEELGAALEAIEKFRDRESFKTKYHYLG